MACRQQHRRRTAAVLSVLAVTGSLLGATIATASLAVTVNASADTWVAADRPDATSGDDTLLFADARGPSTTLLRFDVAIPDGQVVLGASLGLWATDSAPAGAVVSVVADVGWDEATTTWTTQPAIDAAVGVLGAMTAGEEVLADVSSAVTGTGTVSFAITSDAADDATFSSREGVRAPTLTVTYGDPPPPSGEPAAVTTMMSETEGSSDPTLHALTRRIAVSEGGRRLAVAGTHADGVGLRWRDRTAEAWQRATTGSTVDGRLLSGTNTGDWTASITVGRDSAGVEHAWVAMARDGYSSAGWGLYLVRLDDLDAPAGPTVGPLVTLDLPDLSARMADIAYDLSAPATAPRVAVSYTRRLATGSSSTKQVVVAWLDSVDTPTPTLTGDAVLVSSGASRRYASLVPSEAGMRVVVRGSSSGIYVLAHDPAAPLGQWTSSGEVVDTSDKPENAWNGVAQPDGTVLLTGQVVQSRDDVSLVRVSADLTTTETLAVLSGYREPVITGDGERAWIVMVRSFDGAVVSRRWTAAEGLSGIDQVEIGAGETGGNAQWPSVQRRVSDSLLVLTRGIHPATSSSRSAVIAATRPAS